MKVVQWICAVTLLAGAGQAFAFCTPGEVGICYVNGVKGTRVCGSNAMFGPCSVPLPPAAPIFKVIPKYKVLTVIYAPPGKAGGGSTSSVSYGGGSKSGSTTSTSHGFKQNYSVNASTDVGFLGTGGSASVSFSYGRNSTKANAMDVDKSTSTQINHAGPSVDGIDHDRDQIWLWLKPEIDVTIDANSATWKLDTAHPMNIQYVYVGHLKNPSQMPTGVFQNLEAAGLTSEDYAEILAADPYAYGTPALDTNRYKALQTTFPYEPPYAPGDTVPTFSFTAAYASSNTSSTAVENEYSTGFSVTGSANLAIFKAKLVSENKWTWTDSDTRSATNGTSESASVTVGGPSFGYTGPTNMAVYYDVTYKSFLFAPILPGQTAKAHGYLTSVSHESVVGREVVMSNNKGATMRTYTNAQGEFRFFDTLPGSVQLRSGSTVQAMNNLVVTDRTDLVVP